MAVGVNVVFVLAAPDGFVDLDTTAPLLSPWWVFVHVVAKAPAIFSLLVASYGVAIGLMMMKGGRWGSLGLAGGIVLLLIIAPLGPWTVPGLIMAAALGAILLRDPRLPSSLRGVESGSPDAEAGPPRQRRRAGRSAGIMSRLLLAPAIGGAVAAATPAPRWRQHGPAGRVDRGAARAVVERRRLLCPRRLAPVDAAPCPSDQGKDSPHQQVRFSPDGRRARPPPGPHWSHDHIGDPRDHRRGGSHEDRGSQREDGDHGRSHPAPHGGYGHGHEGQHPWSRGRQGCWQRYQSSAAAAARRRVPALVRGSAVIGCCAARDSHDLSDRERHRRCSRRD